MEKEEFVGVDFGKAFDNFSISKIMQFLINVIFSTATKRSVSVNAIVLGMTDALRERIAKDACMTVIKELNALGVLAIVNNEESEIFIEISTVGRWSRKDGYVPNGDSPYVIDSVVLARCLKIIDEHFTYDTEMTYRKKKSKKEAET